MLPQINWNRAATCANPAPGVMEAMVTGLHVLPGDRGTGGQSAAERFFAIRARAATMFGLNTPERVIFTPGATYGLNLAIHCGIADHTQVLTTSFEHNSLLRPLHAARHRGVSLVSLASTPQGLLDLSALQMELGKGCYSTFALSVASNTLGIIQPYAQACAIARACGVQVILDLSQGGGVLPIHLDDLGVAYAALAGHKNLRGPRGIGLLFVGEGQKPKSFLCGGTGSFSGELEMPEALPAHLEAGTSNYPGIYGLGAALDWLAANPPLLEPIRKKMAALEIWCRQQKGWDVLPTAGLDWQQRLPILALHHQTIAAEILAAFLASAGVQVRAGSMCAAFALPALGIHDSILRLSPPMDASEADFEYVRQTLSAASNALS
jgi:cysteine desulfurase / selenocysteine lyase